METGGKGPDNWLFCLEGWQRRPRQSGDGSLGSGKKFFFFFSLEKIDVGMFLGHKEVIQGEENIESGMIDGTSTWRS